MPRFRKLSPAETAARPPALSARALVAQAYDVYLASFVIGDHGRAELSAGERRDLVRQRLHAAACRRGLALRFRAGPGPLTFCVEALPAVDAALAAAALETPATPDHTPPQRVIAPHRRREERRPAGRYDDVLPRWMREGQQPGRRGGGKRRSR